MARRTTNTYSNLVVMFFVYTSTLANTSRSSSAAFAARQHHHASSRLMFPRRMSMHLRLAEESGVDLQSLHRKKTPAEVLHSLAEACTALGINDFDTYGDFTLDKDRSALRQFEHEVANAFGKEDAVFMPSGVMAQNIALLIHAQKEKRDISTSQVHSVQRPATFLCHHSSHLLLHEKEAYSALLGMEAIIISTEGKAEGICIPAMKFDDVKAAVLPLVTEKCKFAANATLSDNGIVALIIELPHRELGGKLTPWQDVEQMQRFCEKHGMNFHCDGARIFEASAGYGLSLAEIARPFDSIYVSTYKGLGALSGALLLGSKSFCREARVWLRRFGGNLRTLMPYISSSWAGFRNQLGPELDTGSFVAKQEKLKRIIEMLASDKEVSEVVSFDPEVPETNMVHGYLRCSLQECERAGDIVERKTGIRVLRRIVALDRSQRAAEKGYGCRFELVMGEANFDIHDETYILGWKEFASALKESTPSPL